MWQPIHTVVFERAQIEVGARVLDLGAGTGDQTFPLARRVGPSGSVVATDFSAEMLELLRGDAITNGLTNIETVVGDAATIDLPPHSFDAAISMNCLQFIPAVNAALTRVRQALKPGRRIAAIVFADAEHNPLNHLPQSIIRRVGELDQPDPREPGMFRLGAPGRLDSVLRQSGFRAVEVLPMPIQSSVPSRAFYLEAIRSNPNQSHLLDRLDPDRQAAALTAIDDAIRQFETGDGLRFPGLALLGTGRT
jgi:SAM-dependent methyltransferase